MPKMHPDERALRRFSQGKLPRRQNVKVAWHLYHCAPCREQVLELAPEAEGLLGEIFAGLEPRDSTPPASPHSSRRAEIDEVFSQAQSALQHHADEYQRDRDRAPVLFEELMRHPVSRRRTLVERTFRFQNYSFAEHLLARAQREVADNPFHAEDLAFLALRVAEKLEGSHYSSELLADLRARAWADVGNARRVYGDFTAAEESFGKAAEEQRAGTGDPLIEARLLTLRASLSRQQERFADATDLLSRARAIYERAGESHWRGRTLLCQALALVEAGDGPAATALLEEALGEVDFEREPRLHVSAKYTAIHAQLAQGKPEEAAGQISELREITARHGGDLDNLHVDCLAAKVALALGQREEAIACFSQARRGFADKRLDFEVARVSRQLEEVGSAAGAH